jgi:hypothetical protein
MTGGEPRVVASSDALGGEVDYVAWGSDASTLLAYVAAASGGSIWTIPLAGGSPRKLLSSDPSHLFGRQDFAADGKRLFFTLGQFERDVYVAELKRP